MRLIGDFFRDDGGNTTVEYSLTFAVFGATAVALILAFQTQSDGALVNTRARMACNGVNLTANSTATVDGSGNITCN